MKKIENDFSQLLSLSNVNFFGNVWLGSAALDCNTVSLDDLRRLYSAVILAYGATSDRELGLPGEQTLQGIVPSRKVVDWYNGSLDYEQGSFSIEGVKHLAIVGNGNIACDISRMLLKPVGDFADSDAPSHVLEALRRSQLETI